MALNSDIPSWVLVRFRDVRYIDLFYSLKKWKHKDWPGCECTKINGLITKLKLPTFDSRKIYLGHILEGEIYFSPIEKTVGPFSHHIDVPDMLCIDSNGNLWGNDEALHFINNKIGEIRFDGWIQHPYFPYSPEDPFYGNYVAFYTYQILRELRMIYTKNYKAVGPNMKLFFQVSQPIIKAAIKDEKVRDYIKKRIKLKNPVMNLDRYNKALNVVKISKQREYLKMIKHFL